MAAAKQRFLPSKMMVRHLQEEALPADMSLHIGPWSLFSHFLTQGLNCQCILSGVSCHTFESYIAARAEFTGEQGMRPYFGEVCRCMAQAVGALLFFLWLHSSPRSWRQRSARHPRPAGLGGRWAAHGCRYRGAAPAVDICNP